MASIKLYLDLRKKVKKTNKYKLVIRVRHAGCRLDFPTLYAFTLEEFDQEKELVRKDKKTTAALVLLRNNVSTRFAQLLADNQVMIDLYNEVFDVATKERQQGIANFAAERLDCHQKYAWQIRSTLKTIPGDVS